MEERVKNNQTMLFSKVENGLMINMLEKNHDDQKIKYVKLIKKRETTLPRR